MCTWIPCKMCNSVTFYFMINLIFSFLSMIKSQGTCWFGCANVLKTSSRRSENHMRFILETSLLRPEDVFASSWRRFCLVSKDVFTSSWRRPQDVLIVVFRTSYRGLGGLHFATDIRFWRRLVLVLSLEGGRRHEDVFIPTNGSLGTSLCYPTASMLPV